MYCLGRLYCLLRLQGLFAMTAGLAIFVKGVPLNETFGAPPSAYSACGPLCYNSTEREKFWWASVQAACGS